MHHYTNKNTIRHFHPTGKIQSNIQLLTKKNIELEKRLTALEATTNQLESKVFEASARVSQAELRAGRFDTRAAETSRRAAQAEERAAEAMAAQERAATTQRAECAEERAVAAQRTGHVEERAKHAEERAERAEERAIRLELKWMKITGIIKMPFQIIRSIIAAPKQLLNKTKTISSVADAEKTLSSSEAAQTLSDHKDEPLSLSPRAQQIYQDLKTPDAQDKDTERCE